MRILMATKTRSKTKPGIQAKAKTGSSIKEKPRVNEKIQVVNVNNGERIETYLITGKRGSGVCCLNGPAARRGQVGDVVIVISYATMDFEEAKKFSPWIVFPKEGNKL